MANVKSGAFREIIIDRCLQSRRGYSTMEIMKKCNDALERRCEPLITATNTIRNDILSIENRWNVVVEPIKIGRNIRYRYQDPNFSIFNFPLNENEIAQLNQAVSLLKRFEGMPGFDWVDELNAHLQSTINLELRHIVGFDENKQLKGMEYFTPLFECISRKEVIKLRYGLDDGEEHTLAEIGKKYNISRERVRQIETKALFKLKKSLNEKKIYDSEEN